MSNPLTVSVARTGKMNMIQPASVESNILPKLPFRLLVCGESGSGKSNAVIHLLNSPALLKGVFHHIYYFTGSNDDSFTTNVKIESENIIEDFDEAKLQDILDKQLGRIEKMGYGPASKKHNTVIIFDDILSRPKFLKSNILLKMVAESRHYLVSIILNTQSYTKIPRALRINCSGLILFPSSRGEMEVFATENCLANMSFRDFLGLVEHCTKKRYSFAFINKNALPQDKLRCNFDTIINYE
jgi:hypothetical protein